MWGDESAASALCAESGLSPHGPFARQGLTKGEAPNPYARLAAQLAPSIATIGLRELFAEDLGEGFALFREPFVALAVFFPDVFLASAEAEAAALVLGGVADGARRELVEQGAHALHDAVEHRNLMGREVVQRGLERLGGFGRVLAEVEQGRRDGRGLTR